jgi:hypothetical protein
MAEKITTIEDLAAMIQRTMASKEDVKKLETTMNEDLSALIIALMAWNRG